MEECARVCREYAESCRQMAGYDPEDQRIGAQERIPADDLQEQLLWIYHLLASEAYD